MVCAINMKTADRLQLVKDNLTEWKGVVKQFAELLKEKADADFTLESWCQFIQRAKTKHPEWFNYDTFNYYDMIPKEWDGTDAELARRLWRQNPSISVNAWTHKIRLQRQRGAITRSHKPHFVVESLKKASSSGKDLWANIEEVCKKAIEGVEHARWADIHMRNIDNDKYIGIAFQSDQHIGNPFCDLEKLRLDTEMINNSENVFVIHAGDYIDNFVIDKPKPAMKAPIPPSVQWKLCEHYIDMTPECLMAIVAGNHDLWTASMTDYDPLKRLAEERGILYHAHELNLRVWVNDIPYCISVRHKRRGHSQLDPSRVIMKLWDDGEADFDIGVVGHHHTPSVVPFTKHGIERWAIRPGAYKIVDSFSEMCGFSRERPTSPMVILNPHTKEIQAFTDLRHGLRTLAALNGDEYNENLGIQ